MISVSIQYSFDFECALIFDLIQTPQLYTTDLDALHHILHNDFDYQKPDATRYALSRLLGNGVLVMEGEQHRFQVGLDL